MNGHARNLARAVLLYFGDTAQRNIAQEWWQVTGGRDFSGTQLVRMAHQLLDDERVTERAASKQGSKPTKKSEATT